jgi:hypothetical protein
MAEFRAQSTREMSISSVEIGMTNLQTVHTEATSLYERIQAEENVERSIKLEARMTFNQLSEFIAQIEVIFLKLAVADMSDNDAVRIILNSPNVIPLDTLENSAQKTLGMLRQLFDENVADLEIDLDLVLAEARILNQSVQGSSIHYLLKSDAKISVTQIESYLEKIERIKTGSERHTVKECKRVIAGALRQLRKLANHLE